MAIIIGNNYNKNNEIKSVIEYGKMLKKETFDKGKETMLVRENDTVVLVEGEQFKYYLNKRTGLFSKLIFNGEDQLMQPMKVNVWIAPTDADMPTTYKGDRGRYDKNVARAYHTVFKKEENKVVIQSSISLASDATQRNLDMQTVCVINAEGMISLDMRAKRSRECPVLQSFGIDMHLAKEQSLACCYKVVKEEQYRLDHRELKFTMKLIPYSETEQV